MKTQSSAGAYFFMLENNQPNYVTHTLPIIYLNDLIQTYKELHRA